MGTEIETPAEETELDENAAEEQEPTDDELRAIEQEASATADLDENELGGADDSYRMFLREIRKYPPLSREAETQLARRWTELRDVKARDKLIMHNLRLGINQASRYARGRAGKNMLMDLIQTAAERGLMKAVNKYDWRREIKFSTYATYWIRQAVSRGAADSTVERPIHVVERINKVKRTRAMLSQVFGREPGSEEIAAELHRANPLERPAWSQERVDELLRISQETVSLDAPLTSSTEGESTRGDLTPDESIESPEDILLAHNRRQQIDFVLETLAHRERRVIQLRYGLIDGRQHTLEEVGHEFGVTRERIRQIEARALKKLARPSKAVKLRDYIER